MTAKRIRKNAHKKIDAIFSNSTTAKAYAEDNGFVGVDVSIQWVKKMAVGRSVEYYDNQNGSYTIRIHSNLWYELYHSNYEVLKKIRESEEPIKVAGLVGEVAKAYDNAGAKKKEHAQIALDQIKTGVRNLRGLCWTAAELYEAVCAITYDILKNQDDVVTSVQLEESGYPNFNNQALVIPVNLLHKLGSEKE